MNEEKIKKILVEHKDSLVGWTVMAGIIFTSYKTGLSKGKLAGVDRMMKIIANNSDE